MRMYKKYLPLVILLACAALASCDASFTVPDPVIKNDIPLIDLKTNSYSMNGYVVSSDRCGDSLPPNARIIVGWEIINYSQKAFYMYGTGTVNDSAIKIPTFPPINEYKFTITIDSNLPKQVLIPDANSPDIIAVGHLFLTTNLFIKNGDTLSSDNFLASDDILGGVELTAIVYVKGDPKLFNKPISKTFTPLKSADSLVQGFNFLRTWNGYPDADRKMTNVYASNPGKFYLNIEKDRDKTQEYNKFWLFQ